VSTIPNNASIWEMAHFYVLPTTKLCASFPVCFWTVMKVSVGSFSFGSKNAPKHLSGRSTLSNNKYPQRLFIFDVFPMTEFYVFFPRSCESN
jgi:hypothetical protein